MTGLMFHVLVRERVHGAWDVVGNVMDSVHRFVVPNAHRAHCNEVGSKVGRIESAVDRAYMYVARKIERKLFMGLVILGR